MSVLLKIASSLLFMQNCRSDVKGIDTGAACWDCAKNGHTGKPVRSLHLLLANALLISQYWVPAEAVAVVRAFWELNRQMNAADNEPDDDWRAAAQRAAQQLRACSASAECSLSVPQIRPPALARYNEVDEMTPEERKIIALEAIAEAVRIWVQLNKLDERSNDGDEGEDGIE